jgi:hypothetical protein
MSDPVKALDVAVQVCELASERMKDDAKKIGMMKILRDSHTAADRIEQLERDNEALRSLLKEAREWLADPSLGTWPYMEGGGFYSDKSKWIARIDDALAK